MEKIKFSLTDGGQDVEFYVLEQTKINGFYYILVSESKEDDAEVLILKDVSTMDDTEALYEFVEEDTELEAVLKIFEELLEDTEIQR